MKLNRVLVMCFVLTIFGMYFVLAEPNGASVTPGTSSSALSDGAGNDTNALAGNITEITLYGVSNTQSWQGYFGNVSGAIRLSDSGDNVMYNWSLTSPGGEVYAANVSSVTWSSIDCFNMSADLSALETAFGLAATDADGVNETFNLNDHTAFFTGSVQHTAGECNNTKLFNNAGTGTFEEVLLSDGTNTVFASILQDDTTAFNGNLHDFEMIVLENGHSGDTSVDTYYFWVELE